MLSFDFRLGSFLQLIPSPLTSFATQAEQVPWRQPAGSRMPIASTISRMYSSSGTDGAVKSNQDSPA